MFSRSTYSADNNTDGLIISQVSQEPCCECVSLNLSIWSEQDQKFTEVVNFLHTPKTFSNTFNVGVSCTLVNLYFRTRETKIGLKYILPQVGFF